METSLVAALILSFAIGLSLGLLGGGGSILAVPVLVFVAGIPPKEAIGMSLAIVGGTSLLATFLHSRSGRVDLRAAAIFGALGAIGSWAGSHLTPLLPGSALMLLFSALMVTAGIRMAFPARKAATSGSGTGSPVPAQALAGFGVGILTGFLGVGGGFLIVPALVLFGGLPMDRAVGTSLAVISMNALTGFVSHLGDRPLRLDIAGAFTAAAICGAIAGEKLSGRLEPSTLRRAFGFFVLAVAVLTAARTLW